MWGVNVLVIIGIILFVIFIRRKGGGGGFTAGASGFFYSGGLVDTDLVEAAEVVLEDLAAEALAEVAPEEIGKTKFIYLFIYLSKQSGFLNVYPQTCPYFF